jgi:cell division initiation protein
MITPLDIENKRFSKKKLNGYDPDEVDDFLDELTRDYEVLYKKSKESDKEIEDLKEKLEHYVQIESTLQNTLIMAQSAAKEVKDAAQKQADQMISEALAKSKEATFDIEQEKINKQKELDALERQMSVYKTKMESLLVSQLDLLKEMNKDN